MRKTITTLLCIISILSFGQVKLHNENEGLLYQPDRKNDYPLLLFQHTPEQDTIPVILQVSDTSYFFGKKKGNTLETLYSWVDDSSKKYHDNNIYWIKGYEVPQLDNTYYTETDIYLDENKKLLNKNIVIWPVKHIQLIEQQSK